MDAVVCEVAVLEQLCVSAGAVGQLPLMDYLSVVVDEIDSSRGGEGCEECVAWRHFVCIDASDPEATTSKRTLFHGRMDGKYLGNRAIESSRLVLYCSSEQAWVNDL